MKKVGLFIPCYVDQFYPEVGIATLRVLENLGIEVVFPTNQTCCGQPMANSGFEQYSNNCLDLFIQNFQNCEYIVSPSGSCVLHIKEHLHSHEKLKEAEYIKEHTFELCEFLTDIVKVGSFDVSFPHKVGLHQSCHGQRGLHLSQASEIVGPDFSKPRQLLQMVKGLELIDLDRTDECCGFGGTFCVFEEGVSVKMGKDRINDHINHQAEFITGGDMSCLMHMEGILRRQKSPVKTIHIAQILVGQ